MRSGTRRISAACAIALGSIGLAASAQAAIDGTLTGKGYTFEVAQTNTTNSPRSDTGNDSGPSYNVTSTSTDAMDQLSNCYATVSGSGASATLNIFFGGSISENAGPGAGSTDTDYVIALQLNGSGVSSLNHFDGQTGDPVNDPANPADPVINTGQADGHPGPGSLHKIAFDSGFKPTALFVVNPTTTDNTTPGVYFTDLSQQGDTAPTVTAALNNTLLHTPVGTGGTNPSFTNASTGLEMSIPLSTLGWDGSAIEATAFFGDGSNGRTNNQVLAPFQYGGDQSGGWDYTYIDNSRQFTNSNDYPGSQFFSIAVPEPTSVGLLGLAAVSLLGRRSRRGEAFRGETL